jgi:2-keto-4-pentenoate hydratase/2-oxohepta-3-ene-1,7-dioic acid hydratase in catechol pathway
MDKLICIGKNYLEHAKELGDAVPEKPVLFLKPPSTVIQARGAEDVVRVPLPEGRGATHHECEIVLRLDAQGRFDAMTLGLDLTLRDLQATLKKAGHPWEVSKVFCGSAVLGAWMPLAPDYLTREFSLWINGTLRQKGRGSEMRFSPETCLDYARTCFPLVAGDALFTGTPAGVGPLALGDQAELKWGDATVLRAAF